MNPIVGIGLLVGALFLFGRRKDIQREVANALASRDKSKIQALSDSLKHDHIDVAVQLSHAADSMVKR